MKGKGGVIGLVENPAALRRWMICGPELARCISEFDESANQNAVGAFTELFRHHEEGLAAQLSFKHHVQNLIDTINAFGNP